MAHSLLGQPLQFLPGIRQDLAPETAPAGTLAEANNVRYGRLGGVYARPGTTAVSSVTQGSDHEIQGSSLSFLGKVGTTALIGTTQGKIFSRDETGGIFNFAGTFSTCLPLRKRASVTGEGGGIAGEGFGSLRYAISRNTGGYVLTGASNGSRVHVSIEDADGARVYYDSFTGTKCASVNTSTGFVLVLQNGTTLTGIVYTITSGVVASSSATVGTLSASSQYWDIAQGLSNDWFMIHQFSASAPHILINAMSGTTSTNSVAFAADVNTRVSIYRDSAAVWVSWVDFTGADTVYARAYSGSLVALSAATVISGSGQIHPLLFGPVFSGLSGVFYAAKWAVGNAPGMITGRLTLPGLAANPLTENRTGITFNVHPISKPDSSQRVWCMTKVDPSPYTQDAISFTEWDTAFQRVVLLRWRGAGLLYPVIELSCTEFETDYVLSAFPTEDLFHAVSENSGTLTFAVPRRLRNGRPNGLFSLEVLEYETTDAHSHRSMVEMGGSLIVAGQPTEALSWSDVGLPMDPEITATAQGTTGALTATGVYSYVAVYEWIDVYGRRHRSTPSRAISVTLTGVNDDVTLTLSCPNWGQRYQANESVFPVVHVYRTLNGGTVYYRITPGGGAPLALDNVDGVTTYLDIKSDAELLVTGEALYTDAALCDYQLAPSCRFVWRDERRVWFGGLWESDQIQCSLDVLPTQPIESSDFAGLNGPVYRLSIGEPATGGEYQDGVNYVFAKNAIYAFSGEGPDRQGTGSFSPPRVITRETGCIDYRSVKATSKGIFFQSKRGIELIPRGGGNPIFVGAAVQRLTEQYPTCRGVAIAADNRGRSLRFLVQDPGAHIVLGYDLDLDAWWSDDHIPGGGALFSEIGEWPDGLVYGLTSQATSTCAWLEQNNGTGLLDAGTQQIIYRVKTTQVRPFGLAGYGRVNEASLLWGGLTGSVSMALTLSLDGVDRSKTFALTTTSGVDYRSITSGSATQEHECTAVVLTVDVTRSAGGSGPSVGMGLALHGFMLEGQAHPGNRRLSAAKQG